MDGALIHQLADWLMVKDARATANAAGLKTCLPSMFIMNLQAIAKTEAQIKNGKVDKKAPCKGGVIIKAKINAVI